MLDIVRALAWKEWREQRGIVLAGFTMAATMPFILMAGSSLSSRGVDLPGIAEALPLFVAGLLWPLFGAACGAATIANEIGEETLGFLLSRPVSRTRIWSVKVAAGLAALASIILGSLAVVWLFGKLAGEGGLELVLRFFLLGSELRVASAVGAAIFMLFSASVFFSTFLTRAMTAAGAGLAASLLVLGGILVIWFRMDLGPGLEPELLTLEILLGGMLILAGSRYVFARGEMLRGSGVRSKVAIAVLMVVASGALVGIPLIYSQVRLSPREAVLFDSSVSPSGEAVVSTAATPDGGSPQVWMVHADGSGFRRVSGRLTLGGRFSPDGKWLAYVSFRGALGLRADSPSLWIARPDGSEAHLLARDLPFQPYGVYGLPNLLFSPDGSMVVAADQSSVIVTPLSDGPPMISSLAGTDLEDGTVLGWTADSAEILLLSSSRRHEGVSIVAALNPRTERMRTIYKGELFRGTFLWRQPSPAGGFTWMPIVTRENAPAGEAVDEKPLGRLMVVDVREGHGRTEKNEKLISESACSFGLNMSVDGMTLVWVECDGTDDESTVSRTHQFDLTTMTDKPLGSFKGRPFQTIISPSGDRLVVRKLGRDVPVVVLDAEGVVHTFEEGWTALGWSGRNRVILENQFSGADHLRVVDVSTGALHQIYPETDPEE